jgi:TRAP-type uncharacterized transport system substrate-binding protein
LFLELSKEIFDNFIYRMGTQMKCEFCKVSIIVLSIVTIGFVIAYQFVPPAPPKQFRLATGSTTGAYYAFGMEYQKYIEKQGFKIEVQPTAGSIEALTL